MVYGLWFTVYGLQFMVYGLWFTKLKNDETERHDIESRDASDLPLLRPHTAREPLRTFPDRHLPARVQRLQVYELYATGTTTATGESAVPASWDFQIKKLHLALGLQRVGNQLVVNA